MEKRTGRGDLRVLCYGLKRARKVRDGLGDNFLMAECYSTGHFSLKKRRIKTKGGATHLLISEAIRVWRRRKVHSGGGEQKRQCRDG